MAYEYDRELKKYAGVNIPVMAGLLPAIQPLMRALYHFQRSSRAAAVKKLKIPAGDGYEMRAVLYEPPSAPPRSPCLIYYHGGGFVYPCAPQEYAIARGLAIGLCAKTLLADYRLAPKYRFPAAAEDAYAAYLFAINGAKKLGIDPKQIILGGDSAGGNLAAAVCLMARDRGQPLPCGQLLLYPFLDRDLKSESMLLYTDTPLCNTPAAKKYIDAYFSEAAEKTPGYFAPLEAETLCGLPPVYIETAEFDCLKSGGLRYYERLKAEGVHAELIETKGTMHGYDIARKSRLVRELTDRRIAFIKQSLVSSGKAIL